MPNSLLRVRYASSSRSSSRNASTSLDVTEVNASALTKKELITALDIDPDLCDDEAGDKGLLHSYSKWKAIKAAYSKMQSMAWNGPKPTYGTIISLFVSTSMFYSHYKYFNDAVRHPEMLEWLEGAQNGPSDVDIWGREKGRYTFSDLMKWVKKAGDGSDSDSSSDGKKRGRKGGFKKGKSKNDGKGHKLKHKSSKK